MKWFLLAVKILLERAEQMIEEGGLPEVELAETRLALHDCELKLGVLRAWQERLEQNASDR